MKYNVRVQATVEADSAETARRMFDDREGVMYGDVYVVPSKEWAVTVSVPAIYTFDLTVNAETADEAEEVATDEMEVLNEIEEFTKTDMVSDYQYDVDSFAVEVQNVEAIEDEGAEPAPPTTEVTAA